MAGSLRLTREQLALITGGDPRAIKAFEDFFATLNNLGAHAGTHEPGGSDPLTVDAIPAVGSLRTLGTGAQKAAAGIHAGTHVTGGGDTIAGAVAGGNAGLLSGADKAKIDVALPVTGTAAALAAANPVLAAGQLGWETDTLSGKIGDGATAYNTLTYFYRGLPVAGESSLGTPHFTSLAGSWPDVVRNIETQGAPYVWDLAPLGVPVGARAVLIFCQGSENTTAERGQFTVDIWDYDFGAFNVGEVIRRGLHLDVQYKPASAAAQYQAADMIRWVKIGSSRKLYCGLSAAVGARYLAADYCGYTI